MMKKQMKNSILDISLMAVSFSSLDYERDHFSQFVKPAAAVLFETDLDS
jgi:hypothetical protein